MRVLVATGSMATALSMPAAHASASGGTITLTETSYYTSSSSGPIYGYLTTLFNNFEKSHPGIVIRGKTLPTARSTSRR